MYYPKPAKPAYRVVRRDGVVVAEYDTLDEIDLPRWIWSDLGHSFELTRDQRFSAMIDRTFAENKLNDRQWGIVHRISPQYVVFDAFDQPVHRSHIRRPAAPFYRFGIRYNPDTFRCAPIAGVRRWRRGGGFRCPRTTQEIRETEFTRYDEDIAEYRVKVRGRRFNLPTLYDDIMRSNYSKNWKRHRRTQYKLDR